MDDYRCPRCLGRIPVRSDVLQHISLGNNQSLECVDKFCYLGDMIAAGGGAEEASRARVRCAWAKFRELAFKVKGRTHNLQNMHTESVAIW